MNRFKRSDCIFVCYQEAGKVMNGSIQLHNINNCNRQLTTFIMALKTTVG